MARAASKSFFTLLPGLDTIEEIAARAGEERQGFGHDITIPSPLHDSRLIEVSVRVTPLADADPGNRLLIEMVDATQRHQIDRESALIAQHDVTRRMISQLAHEIRNPLGGLRGAAQLLERELPNNAQREFTRIIIGEADRLAALMDDLLGPGGQPRKESVNVHEVLEHVAALIESEAPETLALQRDYDPSLPPMLLDRNQTIQAFLNLARNAVQAAGSGGRFLLRTRVLTNAVVGHERHRLVVSIDFEDDGPGVPDEIADTLFYPLVSGRDGGTGLGLSLAQDLVSRQGGLIEYSSESGQTVFMVRLPIYTSSDESDPADE